MKFHNYWTIRTAKGWSCMFLPPLNRPDAVVEVFAGVVDTDTYTAPINFPFVATAADGVYTLEKGTPLVQVIPFRRVDARDPRIGPRRDARGAGRTDPDRAQYPGRRGLVSPPCPGIPGIGMPMVRLIVVLRRRFGSAGRQ